MQLTKSKLLRIYLIVSVISWIAFTLMSKTSAVGRSNYAPVDYEYGNPILINLFLSLFFLAVFQFYRIKTEYLDSTNFNDLIWRGFITGAVMFVALIVTKQVLNTSQHNILLNSALFVDFINNVNIIFVTVFAAKIFYVFKKMIMYQKSKGLIMLWSVFEILAFLSLVLNFFNIHLLDTPVLLILGALSIIALILTLNMKWVAYLNFKQKWRNLLLILLILLMAASFLQYIYSESAHFGDSSKNYIVNDLAQKIFIIIIFIFIVFYCLSSILVILFNFPTSSVFEQKLGEVFNFQRLSQSIQMTEKEDQIYDVLLETSMNTVLADAAWLEIVDNRGNYSAFINYEIEKYDIFEVKKALRKNQFELQQEEVYISDLKRIKHTEALGELPYRSLLLVPLFFQSKYLGMLGLIKNLPDSFNKEIIDIINSFVSQASVSIENSRLMMEAIEHERYKEEIKIAKNVQKRLLPQKLDFNDRFMISAFSEAADEVGGDYYDIFNVSDTKTTVSIADVSGHGTSAAFNMAQLKGIFQSLVQMDLPLNETMSHANNALGRCLEKQTFVTMSLLTIDIEKKEITCCRAGHCPTLYYSAKEKNVYFFENKGMGLGIMRKGRFHDFIEVISQSYSEGDIMLLYTDGIIEAKNELNEEYGYKRLKDQLENNINNDPSLIIKNIINNLYQFCGKQKVGDDYTCLAIKFFG